MEAKELEVNKQASDFLAVGIRNLLIEAKNQFGVSFNTEQMHVVMQTMFESTLNKNENDNEPNSKRICSNEENNQGQVQDNRTVEEKVFGNHLTLCAILRYLDVNALSQVRQVSKLFAEEGLKFMYEKGSFFFKVPPLMEKKSASEQKKIVDIMKDLISTKNIKIENLSLNKIGDIDIFDSLEIPSSQIKQLKFPFNEAKKYQEVMTDKFTSLNAVLNKYTSTPWYNPRMLHVFNSIYKPLTLSHMIFDPDDDVIDGLSSSELYSMVAEGGELNAKTIIFKLPDSLQFFVDDGPLKSLSEILTNNSNMVEEIVIENPLGPFPDSEICQLPKVKKVVLNFTIRNSEDVYWSINQDSLLKDIDFNPIFPNLSTVEVAIFGPTETDHKPFDLWGICFESVKPVYSVKEVIYKSFSKLDFDISRLREIFPRAKFIIKS